MFSPTTYHTLIDTYKAYLTLPPPLFDIEIDPVTGETEVRLSVQFLPHPVFGVTKFRIRETYDRTGQLTEYRYCWEVNSKPTGNISAWENEPHVVPHGFDTDPHHYHHVPFDRHMVQRSPTVRCLADAFSVVIPYIAQGLPYP